MPATITRTVKAKKKCCKSGPRCKRCPAVYKKLERDGLAVREGKRTWTVIELSKSDFRAARKRR
jgi:hypothetical protein